LKIQEKANRFDDIVQYAKHSFTFWLNYRAQELKQGDREDRARHYANLAHEHFEILDRAGETVVCPCYTCNKKREAKSVEKRETGEGQS